MGIVNNSDNETKNSLASSANQVTSWTVDDIKKSDILVFRENATEYVDTVVAPNGFQVGLLDEAFLTDLFVTGHITGSGVIYAELGFSGSLTKLVDGSDYLVAGTGVTLTTQSNGSILIESTGGGGGGLRIKEIYNNNLSAGTPLEVIPLSPYNYSSDTIDVHYNGELLKSGSITEVQTGDADYYLLPDSNDTGQIVFNTNITAADDIVLTINGGGSGGIVSGGSNITAGDGISYSSDVIDVLTDGLTVGFNSSNELEFKRTKGTLSSGTGLTSTQFDGSSSSSFSVKPATGTPITVTQAGVGFDLPGQVSALQLDPSDEILIHDGEGYKKSTVQKVLDLMQVSSGASIDAPYLTISNTSSLNNERAIITGDGIDSIDQGPNGGYIISVALDSNSGLEFASGKLAVDIGSFAGLGLLENQVTGTLELDYSTIVGNGLQEQGGVVSIDFGKLQGQVAEGSNTITVNSGDGLAGGSTIKIGNPASTINLRVNSEEIAGIGLKAEDNNLNLDIAGTGGITVDIGQDGQVTLDGSTILDSVKEYDWGIGLKGELSEDGNETVGVDLEGLGGIQVYSDLNGKVIIDGSSIAGGGGVNGNSFDFDQVEIWDNDGNLIDEINATAVGDQFGLKAGDGIELEREGSNIIIKRVSTTSTSDGGIGIQTPPTANITSGSGISITPGALQSDPQTVALDYEGINNLVAEAPDGFDLVISETDTFLLRDASEDIVKEVTVQQLAEALPAGGVGNGSGTVAATGVDQHVVRISETTAPLTNILFPDLDTRDVPDGASISVYLNGDLLLSGSTTDTEAMVTQHPRIPSTTNTHYYVSGMSTLAFGVGLVEGDYLIVEKTSLSNATNTVLSVLADSGLKQNGTLGDIHIQVDYDGEDKSLIKSAYDGTPDVINPQEDYLLIHDATTNQDKYVLVSQLPFGSGDGSGGSGGTGGSGGGSGLIGTAEDGTYADGLFTDFIPSTPVGTAVDRFNEVLKVLAPPPAPGLKTLDYDVVGSTYSGLLSFDATHPDPAGNFINIQSYEQLGEAGFSVPAVNEQYSPDQIVYPTSNYDETELYFMRAGVIGPNEKITGELNFNVPAEVAATGVTQLSADSYGNADTGTLNLEVNGEIVHSLDLSQFTGSGTAPNGSGSDLNNNGSGFTRVSEPRSSYTEGGKEFPSFKHRSSNYIVDQADMQPGFNIARVIHVRGDSTNVTNYVEWVLDNTTDPITFANTDLQVTDKQGSLWISGVRYHTSMELTYTTDISNVYKAIYSTNPIVTTSSEGVSSNVTIPPIGPGENLTKEINFSNTVDINAGSSIILNQPVSVSIRVPHPIKGNATSSSESSSPLLLYTVNSNATDTIEDFNLEEYRVQDNDFNNQSAGQSNGFYNSNLLWNSTESLAGSDAGHMSGLQIFNGRLLSPVNTIDAPRKGDFRDISQGGSVETYDTNPDYSLEGGLISGTRNYIRYIKNTTGVSQRDIIIKYNGDSILVDHSQTLDSSKIKVSIKFPTNTLGAGTGWMDANAAFQMFDYQDSAGGYVLPINGSHDTTVSGETTNYFTFGKNEVRANEVIIVKIEADTSWNGHLEDLSIEWGASTPGNTQPGALAYTSLPLQQVSIDQTGVEGKLSFGPTNTKPTYSNVYDPDTGAPTDYNEIYSIQGYQRGIFTGQLITGVINDSFNDRFDRGDLGELKLELNGNVIVTVDLTNLNFSSNFVDSNNSGFYNLTVATPSVYQSNGIPSFNNIYRTGQVRIQDASQEPGHNYYRVIHTVGGVDSVTNYCEWVKDNDSTPLIISEETMSNWEDTQVSYQSGVGYFKDPHSLVSCKISGLYTNIYSTDGQAIGFTNLQNIDITNNLIQGTGIVTKNTSSDATTLPNILPGGESEDVYLTGSINWNGPSRVLPGAHGVNSSASPSMRPRVIHPIKNNGNYLLGQTTSKNNFLIASFTNTSNGYGLETFDTETYRMPDGTYTTDTDVTSASWDSMISLVSNTVGYSNGLMQYNGKLIAPSKGAVNGDFTTYHNGGVYQGPDGNPDYSDVAGQEDERIYLRAFYNHTSSDFANMEIDITGVGQLTSELQLSNSAGAIGSNNKFKMFVKLVEPNSNNKVTTGWLDCGEQATGSLAENSGCSTLPLSQLAINLGSNTSVPIQLPTGRYLYGTSSPLNTNYLLIKIVAHKEWTGNLTKLGVSF